MKTIFIILLSVTASFGQIEMLKCEKIDTIKVSILATYNTRNEGGLRFLQSDYSQYEVVTLFIEGYAVGNDCFWRNGRIVIFPEHFKYLDPDKKPLNNKYKIWIVELNQ